MLESNPELNVCSDPAQQHQEQIPTVPNSLEDVIMPSCSTDQEWIDISIDVEPEPQPQAASVNILHDLDSFQHSASAFFCKKSKKTLCPCTSSTANDVILMVLAIGMRHKLTWVTQLDILKMISLIFPNSKIPLTKYRLFNQVQRDTVKVEYHVFCPHCESYLKPQAQLDRKVPCSICQQIIDVEKASNYFCSLSVRDQFRDLFHGPENIGEQMLHFRSNRSKQNQSNLEDIFDGTMYQSMCRPGAILSNFHNFSYNFFTDGVPMGHSGKSIWPIYLMINELPEKLRTKYIILGGLYVGPKEPNLNVFLKPFVKEANLLSSEGFSWCLDGAEVISKAIPLCAIADSPARCKLLNMQNHAAAWGCTFCYHMQERTDTSCRIKFIIKNDIPARTQESLREDLAKAATRQHLPDKRFRMHRGVYGPSSIAELNYFDECENLPVDYMHALLLGAARAHVECLLECSNRDEFWILETSGNQFKTEDIIAAIDSRLLCIKPPKSITRPPQSLLKRKSWKASEWRSWILFYCIVCLKGILHGKYVVHLSKLSAAIYILLKGSVSTEEVKEAHLLIISYQIDYQKYFGQDSMTYNIHLLKHVCPAVLKFGPLWTHSSFPYEGQNRNILQLQTSPYSVVKQIITRYLLTKSFPDLCVSLSDNECTIDFCEEILGRQLKMFVYSSGCYLLGKGNKVTFTEEESNCLMAFIDGDVSKLLEESISYKRMLIKGFRVYALGCTELTETRNVDNHVTVERVGIVVVEKIILYGEGKVLVLVRPVNAVPQRILARCNDKFNHVKQVQDFGDLMCIYPGQISGQCVMMDLGVKRYVSEFPYGCYRD
ncbi:Pimeloyl-[acyl-carrier protein] methyl ester esterase [Frankliniella fusca]|uniref:Pimeloyl-[acyl-carrier protein] methyl ester esterase n=1 Tax=Frankliniella fusca TaxID=407009 RepID=A0AAE1LEP2_9NEOP|nr:Pimeloyl-[acyl-carrier protein] methyl ester esterase [Frankliniella fusca]